MHFFTVPEKIRLLLIRRGQQNLPPDPDYWPLRINKHEENDKSELMPNNFQFSGTGNFLTFWNFCSHTKAHETNMTLQKLFIPRSQHRLQHRRCKNLPRNNCVFKL
jgi:hypothetical protein